MLNTHGWNIHKEKTQRIVLLAGILAFQKGRALFIHQRGVTPTGKRPPTKMGGLACTVSQRRMQTR